MIQGLTKKKLTIRNKQVDIYIFRPKEIQEDKTYPIVWVLDGDSIFNNLGQIFRDPLLQEMYVIGIQPSNRDAQYTPWDVSELHDIYENFTGQASVYLNELLQVLPPFLKEQQIPKGPTYLTGFSLAGLFATYSLYQIDYFAGIGSLSGSFWYPNWLTFIHEHQVLNKQAKVYFSCGTREWMETSGEKLFTKDLTQATIDTLPNNSIELYIDEGGHTQYLMKRWMNVLQWIHNQTK
ncbi:MULTISPECIES: alpha/beta hydrolase-fold protein [unclassified Breznakia]|uniref:alpha/beta hydrolase n=1 Tax=unclassified Breznakia TaxID=2623764 RepID=UPI0024758F7C|nr:MULTISPECIES: alpha/beta hydrolase-fold protein [unclassified Breznakia]MDH6367993.1 putative alpha/beta superfamily hydrolase [Breznakia sp. PH1-1]MDH6405076.1 putative alpha/beta superfamily hydrolase [Breznakia sp. PF1-11]MDH6412796.1 putative alpha/beta superfamily hydrolase [Breznakia sp. PFB1-11]MDH6415151.1 putative alpha/beta superfamily hydrolase [Breznakia sp. PFB1-14]MDH6417462.1 putative alpha/beta superfamily hydrolase [Breznakia sp. PFB1-4]